MGGIVSGGDGFVAVTRVVGPVLVIATFCPRLRNAHFYYLSRSFRDYNEQERHAREE